MRIILLLFLAFSVPKSQAQIFQFPLLFQYLAGCNKQALFDQEVSDIITEGCGPSTPCLEFDVNFVALTENAAGFTEEDARNEVDILNEYFRTEDGMKIVHFKFKSFTSYFEKYAYAASCDLVYEGDSEQHYHDISWKKMFNQCNQSAIADPHAINFYIYDAYGWADDEETILRQGDRTSLGHNNSDFPFIILDYSRLNHTLMAPEEHEMGHAFGLGHLCENPDGPTNIMATGRMDECPYDSGGDRSVGFYTGLNGFINQVETIWEHALQIDSNIN